MVPDSGRIASRLVVASLGAALLVAGCEEESPPDLTGSYTIVSYTSRYSDGNTLTPPAVSGTLMLQQTQVVAEEASGTVAFSITIPDWPPLVFQGVYRNRIDGSWGQESSIGGPSTGFYKLENNILTVRTFFAVSTMVWRRG